MKYILALSIFLSVIPVHAGNESSRELLFLMERSAKKRAVPVKATKTKTRKKRKIEQQPDYAVRGCGVVTAIIVLGAIGGNWCRYYFNS